MAHRLFTQLILTSDVSLMFLDDLFHYYSEDAGWFRSGNSRQLALAALVFLPLLRDNPAIPADYSYICTVIEAINLRPDPRCNTFLPSPRLCLLPVDATS